MLDGMKFKSQSGAHTITFDKDVSKNDRYIVDHFQLYHLQFPVMKKHSWDEATCRTVQQLLTESNFEQI